MKKIAVVLIILGVLAVVLSVLGDVIGLGSRGEIGAAQILGIDVGIGLILLGIGLWVVNQPEPAGLRIRVRDITARISDIPVIVWVTLSFIAVYLFLFLSPVFFAKESIQYLTKYIPDAFVTHIGFDIDMTMGRVGRWLVTGNSPYADQYYYAPLTLVIFAPLLMLGYPAYYAFSTILTLFAFVFCALILPLAMSYKRNLTFVLLLFITGLFSYGFQFELERGQYNVITFALALLAVYLFHYHERLQYFAWLLLSLAIQLKIYPVFMIVMFVRDWRDWKSNLKRIAGLALFNFALLFVLGVSLFRDFVNNLTGVQLSFGSSRREDLSIKGSVLDLTTDGFGLIRAETLPALARYAGLIEGILVAAFVVCLLAVIVHDYVYNRRGWNPYLLMIAVIGMLIVPSASVDYKLPLLIAPLGILLADMDARQIGKRGMLPVALIFIAATAYWLTLYPFTVKPYVISRNFPALFVLLLTVTALAFLRDKPAATADADDEKQM